MSTSPRPQGRSRWAARTGIFLITVFAAITSSTAVVGLDPIEQAVSAPIDSTLAPTAPTTTTTTVEPVALPGIEPCSEFEADFCVEVDLPDVQPLDEVVSCVTRSEPDPSGTLSIVPTVTSDAPTTELRIRVEIEEGLPINQSCFADQAIDVLNDPRGWGSIDDVSFVRVDDDSYHFKLILASPSLTDRLCWPARTGGKYSCRNQGNVIVNVMRWEFGTSEYESDLTTYRTYLLNHEVGHFLGHGHVGCPGPGEAAPVMMQQTKGLLGCLPNGWPTEG